jgi:broad specificity phosphatase PhoE
MISPMTRILLARHGETDWNRDGRWQGHLDAPLNAAGLAQAEALAAHVASLAVDVLYSSDLSRARQTAAAMERTTGLTAVVDADLREVDVGELAGWNREQARASDPAWYQRWLDGAVEGYRRGETYAELHERSVRAFRRVLEAAQGRTAVVVCHGGNIRAIVSEIVGLGADERWRVAGAANCSLTAIEQRRGRLQLATFNETGHLD